MPVFEMLIAALAMAVIVVAFVCKGCLFVPAMLPLLAVMVSPAALMGEDIEMFPAEIVTDAAVIAPFPVVLTVLAEAPA